MRVPAVFVGHGNPMNAIERNEFHEGWKSLARRLPRPQAILCISAHWETQGAQVTAASRPATIHDFHGFPQALFDVRYPAPGDPELAARVAGLVRSETVRLDAERGLDHGAWSVLIAMYPDADIPVVQLSMDTSQPGSHHYALARQLAPLRDRNILVLASGNMVHNLRKFDFRDARPQAWAERCDLELRQLIDSRQHDRLMDYGSRDPATRLAVPTPEHYYPLLYALALQEPDDKAEFFNVRVVSAISMTSVLIGDPGQR
ncbi:MAG: 4,5-DOPA dioxygenase extradiol [Steroidobacteraceae bacterium]